MVHRVVGMMTVPVFLFVPVYSTPVPAVMYAGNHDFENRVLVHAATMGIASCGM